MEMLVTWFALVLHVIFLASVFDIYFTTPIVHGVISRRNTFPPPAERLVLFVADGMRADTFYRLSANKTVAPLLRNIVEENGAWGVSHTRVPTESRPGHVALIAGLYEDPSAITKGWKENPVEFDSLFNQSTFTWAWGSPDILPMFSKACGDHMWTETYAAEDQDFSGGLKSSSWLDDWVFQRFEAFMARMRSERDTLDGHYMRRSGIVFFLHLLATDTAGHTFKPHSREYQQNVKLIDKGVKKVMDLVEGFYGNDGKTAYIFTSDHGMTDWGSHGAGDASETQTPLVAWGAGVSSSVPSDSALCMSWRGEEWPQVDDRGWDLSGVCRRDTWQADISPLMATLIGVPIPVNSVGYLPRSYLDLRPKETAQAAFTNAQQVLSQHALRRALMERPFSWCRARWLCRTLDWLLPSLYQPFPALRPEDESYRSASISRLIEDGEYKKAVKESDELFRLASSGLEYHHRYHKALLLASISLAFVAWILLLVMFAVGDTGVRLIWPGSSSFELYLYTDIPVALLSAFMAFYLFALASPLQYYVYCLLPFVLWWEVARLWSAWNADGRGVSSFQVPRSQYLSSFILVCAYLVGIEILVFSFFQRWVLSLGMVGLALHPLSTLVHSDFGKQRRREDATKAFYWAASCFLLGVFPFMPVVGKEVNTSLVAAAGLAFVVLGVVAQGLRARAQGCRGAWPLWLQLTLVLPLAVWNVWRADGSFSGGQGLPVVCQALSWGLSVLSVWRPLAWPQRPLRHEAPLEAVTQQLESVTLSLAVPYVLLSVNHEGFFLLALAVNAHAWVVTEVNMRARAKGERQAPCNNVRIAYTFMLLIVASFFGTGNMASINSFDPAWVRRFLSVFSPHTMGALIVAKTCIPFLLVSCAFRAVNLLLNTRTKQLFLLVLALSDACGLHFLHLVRDKGSWMEIGSSLSHFVILETMVLFLLLLYGLSCRLMPPQPSAPVVFLAAVVDSPKSKST